jgi:hypothetical protein
MRDILFEKSPKFHGAQIVDEKAGVDRHAGGFHPVIVTQVATY